MNSATSLKNVFTISNGEIVSATCKDVVGNTATTSEVYQPQCTWTNWSCGAADYQKSCSKVTTDTKKVTCTSGYQQKTIYNGSPNYKYNWGKNDIVMVTGTSNNKKKHCSSKVIFTSSCSKSSDEGKYQYVYATKKSGDTYCTVKKCEKKLSGYTNYKAGKPTNGLTCSKTGTKGSTASYSTCTSCFYKVDTCTRSYK